MNTTKIQKLQAAIEAIRALGDGYDSMIDKLQDEIAAIMQAEKQADKAEQRKRATLAQNAAKSNEADIKRQITSIKRQLTMARNKSAAAGSDTTGAKLIRLELDLASAKHKLANTWTEYNSIMSGL